MPLLSSLLPASEAEASVFSTRLFGGNHRRLGKRVRLANKDLSRGKQKGYTPNTRLVMTEGEEGLLEIVETSQGPDGKNEDSVQQM